MRILLPNLKVALAILLLMPLAQSSYSPPQNPASIQEHQLARAWDRYVLDQTPTKPAPDFDKEVLAPLHIIQADEARAAAAQQATEQAQASVVIQTPPPAPQMAYSGSLQAWLQALRSCESGGNYAENTGNGFYGAYQFTIATWNHWQTGYDRADLAPPAVQDETIVENTRASSAGLASQNPGCYRKLGLSAFPPQ